MSDSIRSGLVRFGPFQFDVTAGELYEQDRRIRLQEQPFQLLEMLVNRPGELLTREHIRNKLWPNGTVVEFDHSINTAVKKLRLALSDSAENPRYIETVARRGYRLMVPVEWEEKGPSDLVSKADLPVEPELPSANQTAKRVSHYRVLEVLGGGGMGVVYAAEDLKLGRRVALKFLPQELGSDARALERFEREARAASALEHPNICSIYEFGEYDGQPFMAMHLLEGRTLRQQIAKAGPLPVGDLLEFAIQICAGLEAAHSKGIIHRDIKPANIFITDRREAKILDFGLAQLQGPEPSNTNFGGVGPRAERELLLRTEDTGLTATGINLGTAAYMSPEQVRGEKLDTRSDLFSFGLVLYEMATGVQAFAGETAAILRNAILTRTHCPVKTLNPGIPVRLEEIIARALEKDRELRYQTASEVRTELLQLKLATDPSRSDSRRTPVLVIALAAFLLVAIAGVWFNRRETPSGAELKQRQLTANSSADAVAGGVPATLTQRKIELPYPNFSGYPASQTDGQRAIYKDDATGALMISDLAGKDKRVILKPKGSISEKFAASRDFSMVKVQLTKPDGSKTNAVIKTDGTGYREIGGDFSFCGGEWSWDNRFILVCEAQGSTYQLLKISIADGQIRKLGETKGFNYRFSPDGRFIVYFGYGKIFIMSSQGGESQLLLDCPFPIDWTRDGRYLIFDSDRGSGVHALCLLPVKDGQRAGDPVFIRYGSFLQGHTTRGGTLVYQVSPQSGMYTSWLGTLQSANGSLGWARLGVINGDPAWSPDGTEIAYVAANAAAGQQQGTIRVRKVASGEERELYRGFDGACFWSSVQPSLFCVQQMPPPENKAEAVSISIDSGRAERLGPVPDQRFMLPLFGSRDGKAIYGRANAGIARWEIGAQQMTVLGRAWEASPDERWIGRWQKEVIEIRPMSGGDWRTLVSLKNASPIAFTADGNWVVYQDTDDGVKQGLFRVATSGGQPERLGAFPSARKLDVLYISPDGQKIIAETRAPAELWLLENFEPKQPMK